MRTKRHFLRQIQFATAQRQRSTDSSGFSVVELLVVIAVIGLLIALLLPGVQIARSTSRRVECSARLRDVGVALTNFESAKQSWPDSYKWRIQLLPYLEQAALYEQFEQTQKRGSGEPSTLPPNWRLSQAVRQFICPSEITAVAVEQANYFANIGTGLQGHGFNGLFAPGGPPFVFAEPNVRHSQRQIRAADITDGLSNTVAVSEAVNAAPQGGPPKHSRSLRRPQLLQYSWRIPDELLTEARLFRAVVQHCSTVTNRDEYSGVSRRGHEAWPHRENGERCFGPLIHSWAYDHALPPNSPSCGDGYYGIYTASSFHPNGVNAVFGDGHVRFVSESIDSAVWSALATRNGAENAEF